MNSVNVDNAAPPDRRDAIARLDASLDRLSRWVERHDYRAYDPGDGQLSYLTALTFGSAKLERLLTGVVLRTPFHIRPLLGIKPHTSTKGMGYMAWGYLRRYRTSGDPGQAEKAVACLDWLRAHRSTGQTESCWGNDFTFTTRAGRIPRGTPTIVWSGLIGQAFVDAYETLGQAVYLETATSVCDWIMKLPREHTPTGACLSYVPFDQVSIHNSNMLGAGLLARVGAITRRTEFIDVARQAMRYSCARQNADGGWFYGEAPKYHWLDSFHTGYNLDSLNRYLDATGESEFLEQLDRGYRYFKENFFEPDGRVRYMHDRLMPIDIQCIAQSIDTLAFFSQSDNAALPLALKAAQWAIDNMQDRDGHFYYRDLGWKKVRTPMFHWGQGTMFKALSHLSQKMHNSAGE